MTPWGRGKKQAGCQDPGVLLLCWVAVGKRLPSPGLCERLGRRVDSREEEAQEFFGRVRKAGVRLPRLGAC